MNLESLPDGTQVFNHIIQEASIPIHNKRLEPFINKFSSELFCNTENTLIEAYQNTQNTNQFPNCLKTSYEPVFNYIGNSSS